MENYKEHFDLLYLKEKDNECPPDNKLQFLGNKIFNFTTYDSSIDELFAKNMLDVIECILNKTQFDYQVDENNYINYLTMVNMPFLYDKLEWGTSIRGAWFNEYGHQLDKTNNYYITFDWEIPKKNVVEFMRQLLEWSKE